jgi:antitoxin HicB
MRYTIVLQPDEEDRGYTVIVPALPGCITQGRTKAEALANAREAIQGYLEALQKSGEAIPQETKRAALAQVVVREPAETYEAKLGDAKEVKSSRVRAR